MELEILPPLKLGLFGDFLERNFPFLYPLVAARHSPLAGGELLVGEHIDLPLRGRDHFDVRARRPRSHGFRRLGLFGDFLEGKFLFLYPLVAVRHSPFAGGELLVGEHIGSPLRGRDQFDVRARRPRSHW